LNTIVEAVDKIRDTANSHDRLFIVEVMGKDAGFIALRSGVAVGAEAILVPETETYIDHLLNKLGGERRKNKSGSIVIVAEGDGYGGAYKVADAVREKYEHFDIRVSILGHIQRGGNPSAFDRVLASRLGAGAVSALLEGRKGEMIGLVNKELVFTPFEKAVKHHKELNKQLLSLAEILAL
jgi:6-phosphofructokinase 1